MKSCSSAEKKHLFSAKELFALLFPLALEQLLTIAIGMADTIMVSSYSESAVSAVSSVDLISWLFIVVFSSFSTGGAVIVSQYIGRRDLENAKSAAKNLTIVSIILSLIMTAITIALKDIVLHLVFGTIEESVYIDATKYYIPIALSYPFLALFDATTAISRSVNKTKRIFFVSLLMNVINISGNYILIHIVNLGSLGAGIASLLSRIIGSLVMLFILMRKTEECSLSGITRTKINIKHVKNITRIAIPSAFDGALFQVGKLIVQSQIATLGTSSLAIHAIVCNFNSYCNIPQNAFVLAVITLVGQAAGAERKDEERYWTKWCVVCSIITTTIFVLPMFIFTPQVVSIYGLNYASSLEAIPICRLCLIACTLIIPFAFTIPNALNATGDVKYTMIVSILSMWIFRVALVFILLRVFNFGVDGVWYAMYADWSFRGLLYTLRFCGTKWQNKKAIKEE